VTRGAVGHSENCNPPPPHDAARELRPGSFPTRCAPSTGEWARFWQVAASACTLSRMRCSKRSCVARSLAHRCPSTKSPRQQSRPITCAPAATSSAGGAYASTPRRLRAWSPWPWKLPSSEPPSCGLISYRWSFPGSPLSDPASAPDECPAELVRPVEPEAGQLPRRAVPDPSPVHPPSLTHFKKVRGSRLCSVKMHVFRNARLPIWAEGSTLITPFCVTVQTFARSRCCVPGVIQV